MGMKYIHTVLKCFVVAAVRGVDHIE